MLFTFINYCHEVYLWCTVTAICVLFGILNSLFDLARATNSEEEMYFRLSSMFDLSIFQVRTIEVSGASSDEVRNFEFSCLGEVRMLSLLKHSCIVEYYGHKISSKWSVSANGKSEGRKLQSAILMEYIKGGSLKVRI